MFPLTPSLNENRKLPIEVKLYPNLYSAPNCRSTPSWAHWNGPRFGKETMLSIAAIRVARRKLQIWELETLKCEWTKLLPDFIFPDTVCAHFLWLLLYVLLCNNCKKIRITRKWTISTTYLNANEHYDIYWFCHLLQWVRLNCVFLKAV